MNLHALPFYATASQQLYRTRCQQYGTGLVSPQDRLLPFVVARTATGQGLDCILVFAAATGQLVASITPAQVATEVYSDGVMDYYVYYGGAIAGLNLACDQYYLDVKGQVSEVFTVSNNTAAMLRIDWSNSSDLPGLPYSKGFQQRLYLQAALGAPDYDYQEEGEKDGLGELVPLNRTLGKKWEFDSELVPEFLLDVLESLTLHDAVIIGGHADARKLKVKVVLSTPDACAMLANVEFSEAPVHATQCAPPVSWLAVDTSAYTPKPWLCGGPTTAAPFWENTGGLRCVTTSITYNSSAISAMVSPNNCPANTTPVAISYTLAAGFYSSTISQADADTQAQAYFDSTKQAYANSNGGCQVTVRTVGVTVSATGSPFQATFTRNDTAGDLTIYYSYTYTVPGQPDGSGSASAIIPDGQSAVTIIFAPFSADTAQLVITSTLPATYGF